MINWKELEKFIAPGKVCTLVILVDGKEIGAFSFNIETLAYKQILENIDKIPVTIAEKPVEKKVELAKQEQKKKPVDKNDKTGRHPDFNPIPATDASVKAEQEQEAKEKREREEKEKNDDDDNRNFDVDENTGEILEFSPSDEQVKDWEDSKQPENIAELHHPTPKKTIEPVAAATLEEDDIIPEKVIVTEKKETVNQNPNQNLTLGDEEPW